MRKHALLALTVLAIFGLAACDEDSTSVEEQVDEIVGTWVSAGSDIAPGLAAAPFNIDSIIATFNDNNTYTVIQWAEGQDLTVTGTYQIGPQPEGEIRAITVNQTAPAVTSQGIFQVGANDGTMQYEIIQTDPAIQGVNPPTVEGGFGSTTVQGVETGVYWVQNYDRRN